MPGGESIKIVVVGNSEVGKTSMVETYIRSSFPTEHFTTHLDSYMLNVPVNNVDYEVGIWDTAGQQELRKIRECAFSQTDVFIVCFSLVDHQSFKDITALWVEELNGNCPNVPLVLVGTKSDLRNSDINSKATEGSACISTKAGEKLAKKIHASMYVECSAKMDDNIKPVFDEAITCYILKKSRKSNHPKCQIL